MIRERHVENVARGKVYISSRLNSSRCGLVHSAGHDYLSSGFEGLVVDVQIWEPMSLLGC